MRRVCKWREGQGEGDRRKNKLAKDKKMKKMEGKSKDKCDEVDNGMEQWMAYLNVLSQCNISASRPSDESPCDEIEGDIENNKCGNDNSSTSLANVHSKSGTFDLLHTPWPEIEPPGYLSKGTTQKKTFL